MKFYSIGDFGGPDSVHRLMSKYFGFEGVDSPDKADIIIWNGGADIGTQIYGENSIHRGIPEQPSIRDRNEMGLFFEYAKSPKLKLGICRGAQLLNCLNGGKLYQDVNNHTRDHEMIDIRSGEIIKITSTHHQQMRVGDGGLVIGVANESTYKAYDGHKLDVRRHPEMRHGNDLEVVWYAATKTLCIQGHPEYVPTSRFADYTLELIQSLYIANLQPEGAECAV